MARKPCCAFIEMPTLYQKITGYGLLILFLLIGGWGGCASTPSDKRKVTIAQRFEKPETPVQSEVTADKSIEKPTLSGKPKETTKPSVEKPTLLNERSIRCRAESIK